jgi:predicted AlkP superfamily phosphohydrolase/phosphomutase
LIQAEPGLNVEERGDDTLKVFVIGIDGATLTLLQPLMDQGYLPFLSEVKARGAMGRLTTIFPPVTAPAWASFMTGKNPGKHGIYEFLHRRAGTLEQVPVNSGMCGSDTLWEMLSRSGKRMVVVSVPLSYPPLPLNGVLLSDFLAPKGARDLSYPPELLAEVESRFGPYLLYHRQVYTKSNVANVLAELEEHTAYRQQVAEYLMQGEPWDFCMVYFEGTDRLQHELWHIIDPTHPMHDRREAAQFGERTRNFYRLLDEDVRRLVELAGPEAVTILVSDHGFGPIHKFVNFNIWLLEQGLLKLKHDLPTRLKRFVFDLGLTPSLGYRLSMRFGFANLRLSQGMTNRNTILEMVRRVFLSFHNVDWTRTRAFSMGNYGQIYVNLKGREPFGSVEPDDYEAVRGDICARLAELRDPQTKQRVVAHVFRTEELFSGPFIKEAPDVAFLLEDHYKALGTLEFASRRVVERVFGNSGDHRMDGIIAMLGEAIKPGAPIPYASIMDLVPTILYLMEQPIPEDLDGRVLTEPLCEELLAARPIRQTAAVGSKEQIEPRYTAEEAEEVKERLRALGYLG